ncbi:MAG TPA: DICT sensory domain-containing protein, partial [Nocardioidaceae bacterium]
METGFSIQELASRTGLTPNVLRAWENRYGFPAARRTAAGHRRFTDDDVRLVLEVLRSREQGLPLRLAISSALGRQRHTHAASAHGALIREFPELAHRRFSRSALVAVSRALEDETLASGERRLILGAFQQGHRYEASHARWEELARTAAWCAVVADFEDAPEGDLDADPGALPARCHLPQSAPMRREWTVVSVGDAFGAVVSAWQVPTEPHRPSLFEAVISTRREVAVVAARVITAVAEAAGATPTDP